MYFVRVADGQPALFRSSMSGGDVRQVGGGPLPGVSRLSPVSPDGSALIAIAGAERWLVSLPDGARHLVAQDDGVRIRSVAWLPDSRHIVVTEETTALIGSRLSVQDTRSAARRLLLQTVDGIGAVTASSDGARLVYSGGPVERDLVEYSGEGRFVRTVAASSMLEGFPSWSPAGDRFVYRVGGPGQSDSLWMGTADGAAETLVQRLTSNVASQSRVSPDGGRIAYRDPEGIQVVSVSGGRAIRVLSSTRVGGGLCWSHDGNWIWYSEGPESLGRVPSGGGEAVLGRASGVLLDCSPDGRWLVSRGDSRSGQFVLTATDGTDERVVESSTAYATRADNAAQFGDGGKRLYLLGLDRRTIDVLDVETGRTQRTITFDIPPEDQIEGFSFSADGSRVLLTKGGDRNDLWMAEGFARPATSWSRWFGHWESPPSPGPGR